MQFLPYKSNILVKGSCKKQSKLGEKLYQIN